MSDPVTVGPGAWIAWDYASAALTGGNVTRFELAVNGGAWASVGLPAGSIPQTYETPLPTLSLGPHTVAIRACAPTICGAASSLPIERVP